jgi:hypothetical protein
MSDYNKEDSDFIIGRAAAAALPDGDPNERWKFNQTLYSVKTAKATGKFGEEVYAAVTGGQRVNQDGYDVLASNGDKVEVKTSFLTSNNNYWVNQIYYERNSCAKDWTHLAIVLIGLDFIEIWEAERPSENTWIESSSQNGYQWRGKDSSELPECFELVAKIPT